MAQYPIEDLLTWAKSYGTSLHPDVEIYQDEVTGLSFRARPGRDIPPGSKIVDCAYQTMLSYLNAIDVPSFSQHSESFPVRFIEGLKKEDPNIIGYFFLMQQYLLREKSFWWNYIRLLPQPDQPEMIGLPIWWPETDRKFLNGTNAEPPIKKRKVLWQQEWDQAIALLKDFDGWEQYTYILYQWAASIFGARSFRASLTIPEEIIQNHQTFSEHSFLDLEHIQKDHFSVLLPVMDIGNHNGLNEVDWSRDASTGIFGLSNRELIARGSQIYNYYGDKSNSELLVGYGFTLPNPEKDVVNLKLTPDPDALQLRRSQVSHVVLDTNQPEQEFMFHVRLLVDTITARNGLRELSVFSPGLVDTMSCMVANRRERRFLLANPDYSVESDQAVFSSPLSRNIILVLRILYDKLQYEISKIEQFDTGLVQPTNQNQRTALDYRNRQMRVLQMAIPSISACLQSSFATSTFCQHSSHNQTKSKSHLFPGHEHVEFLSLECAFTWLHIHYPDLASATVQLISEDQDEPVPLNWAILVEDWDHTYWTVWIYIIWVLRLQDKTGFEDRHPNLTTWMSAFDTSYETQLADDRSFSRLHADSTEEETIDLMIQGIARLFDSATSSPTPELSERLRNFASYISHEETIPAGYQMVTGPQAGDVVEQKLLCIAN